MSELRSPQTQLKKKKNLLSLTESKLRVKPGLIGVIDDTIGHGKLALILRWIHRLNLSNYAPL